MCKESVSFSAKACSSVLVQDASGAKRKNQGEKALLEHAGMTEDELVEFFPKIGSKAYEMRLMVDASTLVGELLRKHGRAVFLDP